MHDAVGLHDSAVQLHEACAGKPLVYLLHLRVGEGNPYLVDLSGSEEVRYQLYAGTQKRRIGYTVVGHLPRTRPYTRALDVDTYEILFGEAFGQPYGIFTLAASELEHYRVVIVEIIAVPASAHGESLLVEYPERILEHTLHLRYLAEFL